MRDGLGQIETVALVGATSDLGLAAAHALTRIGARRFLLVGRPSPRRAEVAAEFRDQVVEIDLDLTDPGRAEPVADQIFAQGDVDVVLLAAGLLSENGSVEDAAHMADVNYRGTLAVMLACARRLADQGHGQLVVFSSAGVTRPRPANYVYGSTKAALDFAARGLAMEIAPRGVTVTVMRPNFVRTKMTEGLRPAPLAIGPERVAEAVVEAVADQKRGVVWVPGAVAVLARAMQVLPSAVVSRLDR